MFGITALLDGATILDVPVTEESLTRRRTQLPRELKKRNGYAAPLRGVARVMLPSASQITDRLITAAQPPDWSAPVAFAAAEALLLKPSRLFPMPDETDPPPDYRVRRIMLVTSVSIDDEVWVGFGELRAAESTKARWVDDAFVISEWLSDADAVADRLEDLYTSAPSLAGLPKATPAWWVGGCDDLGIPERRRIAAVGQVAGLDIALADTLNQAALFGALGQGRPEYLAVWRQRLDPFGHLIVGNFTANQAEGRLLELDADEFGQALAQLREKSRAVAFAQPATEEDAGEVRCVLDAVHQAEEDCQHIVILKEAKDSARDSYYQRPAHVLSLLRALDDVVGMWKNDTLPEGGFEPALTSLGVAGYRADISSTAKQKYGDDYMRSYGTETVMLGPHIANGTGSITRILRIYWYVDQKRRTFVIGHVGKKLRDKSNP
jgi:hypothetical protein